MLVLFRDHISEQNDIFINTFPLNTNKQLSIRMNPRKTTVIFALALLSAIIPCSSNAQTGDKSTYKSPIIDKNVPDPTIIRAKDGYFYLYATENAHNIPIYRSTNLTDWTFAGNAFAKGTKPEFLKGAAAWAPDINYIKGKYVLYYAKGIWGNHEDVGVGVTVADNPLGPFEDKGAVLVSKEIGVKNSIDQFFIRDHGKNYLIWGSFRGIYMTELTSDGLRIKESSKLTKLAGDQMEASYVFKKNGYYYLFGSAGSCCEGDRSTYTVIYGRSKKLAGPYVTRDGKRLLDGDYDVLMHGNDIFAGPGHNAEFITDDAGDDWIIYHSYQRGKSKKGRLGMLDRIKWKDGWPYVENTEPSSEHTAPYFKTKKKK